MKKALIHLQKADPVLAAVIRKVGPYAIEYRDPVFETLVRSIVSQQVSGVVARVIYGRLQAALPLGVTPDEVLKLAPEDMRKLGLSTQKTNYIRDLAQLSVDGVVDFHQLSDATDEEVIATLTKVKGIGVWTAQMFLIFALARHDVLPVGDLGVRKAIQNLYKLKELPKPDKMEKLARKWRPYCSVATWYLWRSLDGEAQI